MTQDNAVIPHNSAYAIVGGAGFIGSHFAEYLLSFPKVDSVTIIDNFSSGTMGHLATVLDDKRLSIHQYDLSTDQGLENLIPQNSSVIHLASNPDIAAAAVDPSIDFYQGTALSNAVAEGCRVAGASRVLYASGSGVYGDYGSQELAENDVPMRPVSTYGASKLAGEALFCSYAFMFDIPAVAFRFGNVIGARQTHGVGYDFVRRLKENPKELRILGDGLQSKTYVHVSDIVKAVLTAEKEVQTKFEVFNVGTDEYVTVNEIADIAMNVLGLENPATLAHTGGDRGWKGDVPVLRLNTTAIRSIGWNNNYSTKEALKLSMESMLKEIS